MSALQFIKLELKHVPLIKPFFEMQQRRLCDCTIGSTMMWRDYFDNCFVIEEDTLVFRSRYLDGKYAFTFPIGPNTDGMLDRVEEYCRENEIDLEFCTVTPFDLNTLKARWPEAEVEENRDWFDYLYESRNMVEFSGKKYATQRNHINRFDRDYPDWTFERMGVEHVEEVRAFFQKLTEQRSKEGDTAREEEEKVFEVLDHFEEYGFLGGLLRVQGEIVGLSMGEIVRDTLFVHIEKANTELSGVYQKLVQCFVREFVNENVCYINREEDVGDPGLRKSKMSYRPLKLLEKYTVRVNLT